eukprot:scaffold105003_cov18-Prasinocladus_malaysianus.AAC.1
MRACSCNDKRMTGVETGREEANCECLSTHRELHDRLKCLSQTHLYTKAARSGYHKPDLCFGVSHHVNGPAHHLILFYC